jgi:ATP-dependent exoDNAse (exonuclease V) alpha subunit
MAIAPTMSAVEELQKVASKDTFTIERLLLDQRAQATLSEKVLIVDEAGMVSGRQMWDLLKIAERNSARLIFSGDTKQIQGVEACDALRVLEKESQLKSIELIQVQRQRVKEYREAIKELRRDPTAGFERFDAIGAIREVPWLDRANAVAEAFAEAELIRRKALVVCATHEEIDRVTEAIRSRRKRTGQLGSSVEIGRNISLNWTTAQKSEMRNFRPGQLLVFHRAVKGIGKNETVDVKQVEKKQIIVRTPQGKLRALNAKQAKSFDVCEKQAFEVAPGDKLLITANRRTPGFKVTNGEIVAVNRIDQHGFIGLDDGRVVPSDFRQFTYGYAVTAHRSQGKSVDEVIISADGMKKELFYVAASRGRESVRIITSDKEMLCDTVGRSNARQSASELARSVRPGLHQGMNRGFAAACRLARWAARYVRRLGKPFALAKHSAHQPIVERTHDWSFE